MKELLIAALISVPATVIGTLLANEAQALLPSLIRVLHRLAVRLAPLELRERLNEEWTAHLEDTPGLLLKLATSFGFVTSAYKLRQRQHISYYYRKIILAIQTMQNFYRCFEHLAFFIEAATIGVQETIILECKYHYNTSSHNAMIIFVNKIQSRSSYYYLYLIYFMKMFWLQAMLIGALKRTYINIRVTSEAGAKLRLQVWNENDKTRPVGSFILRL